MAIGPIVAAAAGLGSTLLTNHFQRKENERSREYNLKLAQMQNAMNVEQWQRENDYNSPTAQLQRLKAAGLNPDMMYGGSGISNTAASSPSMTAGAPGSPANLVGMPNSVADYLDAQLKQAQIDNINADTQKKGAETSILTDDATFRKEYNQGVLNLQNAQIKLTGERVDLTQQQIQESQARCTQIQASVQEILANISKIKNDINISKALSDSQIKEAASRTNLNYAQAKNVIEQLPHVIKQLNSASDANTASANLKVEELGHLQITRSAVQFEANVRSMSSHQSDLNSWQNVMMFLGEITQTLGRIIH